MRGAILPLPQYVSMVWCLVKHRDNFIFYLFVRFILIPFQKEYKLHISTYVSDSSYRIYLYKCSVSVQCCPIYTYTHILYETYSTLGHITLPSVSGFHARL
jgi:hypothetical protein